MRGVEDKHKISSIFTVYRGNAIMLDFVYIVTFEYEDEFEVVGAARTRKDAEEYIEKIILTLPLRNNTEERKDKNNYYITGAPVYKNKLQQALDNM